MSEKPNPEVNDLTVVEPKPLAVASADSLIRAGIDKGIPPEALEKLIEMRNAELARLAEAAFNQAYATFKATCPRIVRQTPDNNPNMRVTDAGGVKRTRKYASLDDNAVVVDGPLSAVGLAYDWDDAVMTDDGFLTRNFVLRHRDGHSRSTCSPPMPVEGTAAWKKMCSRPLSGASPQQAYGVADSYARRYSMNSGLGLTSVDDPDGAAIGGEPDAPTITGDQFKDLNDLYLEAKPDERVFFKYFRITTLSELLVSDLEEATDICEAKIDKDKKP